MEETDDPSEEFLKNSRFWIQKVLVPIVVFIGVGGNIVTVMVLTRKRMRCSTNTYLTALAIADIVYLLFVFFLSFSTYKNMEDKKYALYWRFYGLSHWLCDAASYTSVWLTVSFTVERYIAVCHPIKGKVFCTERRAKSLIVIITLFCVLTTASTTFEFQLALKETCTRNCTVEEIKALNQQSDSADIQSKSEMTKGRVPREQTFNEDIQNLTMEGNQIAELLNVTYNGTCCEESFTIGHEYTSLGKNQTYKTIFWWYSAIWFALLPLVLIATFNCFLIHSVYKSQKRRKKMTNSQDVSLSNENRITIMLIGVVLLFLTCQIPWASFLIYEYFHEIENKKNKNIFLSLGNIFNLLVNLNAASNFVLYCVLSKKYRTTFKSLFCERRKNAQDSMALTTTTSRSNSRFQFKNGLMRRNISEYKTPRNLETQSLTSIPRSKSLMTRAPGKAKSSDINL